jgi:hypothetical protein
MSKVASIDRITIATSNEDNQHINGVELNMLTIMTGLNGSGKSMFLVTSYVISEIATFVVKGFPNNILKQTAQFVCDSCYNDKLTGRIEGFFDTGSYIAIHLENGTVTEVTTTGWEKVQDARAVSYMSAAMRTFEAIGQYLFTRKLLMSNGENSALETLCKNYKLYDVKHIERMIGKMPLKITQSTQEALKNFDVKDEVETFDVDLERCDFFYKKKGSDEPVFMRTLGNGHQSIFNMVIAQQ